MYNTSTNANDNTEKCNELSFVQRDGLETTIRFDTVSGKNNQRLSKNINLNTAVKYAAVYTVISAI